EALGVRGLAIGGDLARGEDVARLAREAEARPGGVDVLVNNASNYLHAPFDKLTEAIWDASLDVNLKAPFLLGWHLGRAMRARGRGRIVNLADWAGERPYTDYLPYCVSKAGVICLTKALAKALAPAVQVNAVAPGPVLPPEDLTPSEREAIVRATPLRRFGTPEDVARCVRFLVEEADFTTGAAHWSVSGRGVPGRRAATSSNYLPGRNLLLASLAAVHCARHRLPALALALLTDNPFADATPAFLADLGRLASRALGTPIAIRA